MAALAAFDPGAGALSWAAASLLIGLRVAPVFAMAPPFTLTATPPLFRVLFGLALSATLATGAPLAAGPLDLSLAGLTSTALRELFIGAVFVAGFQIAYAGLYFAGRTIDIQAGLGLAGVIDPTTRAQTPLVGTVFALAAALVFFGLRGDLALLRLFATSLDVMPLGQTMPVLVLERLGGLMSAVFVASFGVAAAGILTLFLADVAIALMSRTTPQMSPLSVGLPAKVVLLVLVLPTSLGAAGAGFAHLTALLLDRLPGLLAYE
jgi:flagellar biosynthetic protein FliR